jgi:hypothetical protein
MVLILFAMWKVKDDQHKEMMKRKDKSTSSIIMAEYDIRTGINEF